MRYVLKLEAIGDGFAAYLRHYEKLERASHFGRREIDAYRFGRKELQPWVARLRGLSKKYDFDREFMQAQRDYTEASSTGNRGIWLYYALRPGIYEINERMSWGRRERYFLRVINDESAERISKEEVLQCFKNENLESVS